MFSSFSVRGGVNPLKKIFIALLVSQFLSLSVSSLFAACSPKDVDMVGKYKIKNAIMTANTTPSEVATQAYVDSKTPKYVFATTGTTIKSVSTPSANTWYTLPYISVTIPTSGKWMITYNVRAWQDVSTSYFWKKHRALKNNQGIPGSVLFAFNKNIDNLNADSTHTISFVADFNAGDKIELQVFWGSYVSGTTRYSNGHGGTNITGVRVQ